MSIKESQRRRVSKWFLGETLGKGGYSWVKKGYDCKDGRVVALKFTSKANICESKRLQEILEPLRQIKHKHILQLLAYDLNVKYPDKNCVIIPSLLQVLEYVSGGSLFDVLIFGSALSEKMSRTYFKQLMSGIEALHEADICHKNIKPQNLLLDEKFQLKISDGGSINIFENSENKLMPTFYIGTRGYQSPEVLKKKEYTTACDLFSCGVVLFILLSGYPPFEAASPKCRWYAPLAAGDAREFWKQHRGCGIPGSAKDLITRMLWYDFNKRISIRGTKKHKWFNGVALDAEDLTNEILKLKHLMEIKRREDCEKQKQLADSIKRDICTIPQFTDQFTLGLSVGGAKDINTFRKNIENNVLPRSEKLITSQGLFYDYYFDIYNKNNLIENNVKNENYLFYPRYSHGKTKDINTNEYEYWLAVGLDSNIKQEGFKRPKLNLVIVIDNSGSMNSAFQRDFEGMIYKSKMTIAQESLVMLLSKLNEYDNFGLISFNSTSIVHYKLQSMKNINLNDLKQKIFEIEAEKGTNFESAITSAVGLYEEFMTDFKENDEYENRVIYLTDANPTIGSDDADALINLAQNYSEGNKSNILKIYTTFIGIGLDFNALLVDKINNFEGCNYYSVYSQSEFNQQMTEEFDFMVTPMFFNISLKIKSESLQIENIYGINDDDAKWAVENILDSNKNEAQIINLKTLFPSHKKQSDVKEVKGGIILLKLKQVNTSNINAKICVSYENKIREKYQNEQMVHFECKQAINDIIENDGDEKLKHNNYYDSNGIRKGILLSKYYDLIKNWLKYEWNPYHERNDLIISISTEHKQKFQSFQQFFRNEIKHLHDDTLKKELLIIDKLATMKPNILREQIEKQRAEEEQKFTENFVEEDHLKCVAPQLPSHEIPKLSDIHTTQKPSYVLQYMQKRAIELGGTAAIDVKDCSMQTHLSTHNFPAPVTIEIRIYEEVEKNCYVVKFQRIDGDVLHYGRVLRTFIRKSGHVLTGAPNKYFNETIQDKQLADKYFGGNTI